MLYKARQESIDLLTLRSLNNRFDLSIRDRRYYLNLEKGYEGEVLFDELTKNIRCECLILNDLNLKVHHTSFQIDTIIIAANTIYFYEIKNFEGNYYNESNKFYKKPNSEIINPLHQISRAEPLLRQLVTNLGYHLPIQSFVVFINPAFTLYQAPRNTPIIFPTQIEQYFAQFNNKPSEINKYHKTLADKLVSLHQPNSRFAELPSYNYEDLKKGITCVQCHAFIAAANREDCVCEKCFYKEDFTTALMRSVKEFILLFPHKKITTNIIFDWCSGLKAKRTISQILTAHMERIGTNRWTYFK